MIRHQKEISGIAEINWQQLPCLLTRQFSFCDCKNLRLFRLSFVRNQSVQIPSKPGRRRLICFWNHINTKSWIESTENRWSSSGQFSQDSLHRRSSQRFRKWWLKWSMNLSSSKDEWSSVSVYDIAWWQKRKPRSLCCEFSSGYRLCSKLRARTSKWRMGLSRFFYDD